MRAAVLADNAVDLRERPIPDPGSGEIRVRVAGAGLNRADLLQRAGRYPAPPGVPVDIPGLEFAGTVDATGEDAREFVAGDEVFGITAGGAHAEYVVVPEVQCARTPRGADLVLMGGVPEAFVTAHDAMVTQARVAPGEWVLVHAVGSGVGTASLQLAKAVGARVVGTARTPEKLERCRALGLDAGIVTPAAAGGGLDVEALTAAVVEATGGGADVTLDLVGGAYVEADVAAARVKGRIVCIGTIAGGLAQLNVGVLLFKRLQVFGTVLRARTVDEKAEAVRAFAHDVVPLLDDGRLSPVVDRVVPLSDAGAAYDLLATDATFGKVILDCR